MPERCMIESVFYEGEWPIEDGLISAIAWLQEKLDQIPSGSRVSATLAIGNDHDDIVIFYKRPETDDEMARRREKEERDAQRRLVDEKLAAEDRALRAARVREIELGSLDRLNRALRAARVREIELGSLDRLIKKYPERAKTLLQSAPDQSASEPGGG